VHGRLQACAGVFSIRDESGRLLVASQPVKSQESSIYKGADGYYQWLSGFSQFRSPRKERCCHSSYLLPFLLSASNARTPGDKQPLESGELTLWMTASVNNGSLISSEHSLESMKLKVVYPSLHHFYILMWPSV
jgi:hypothetical protein